MNKQELLNELNKAWAEQKTENTYHSGIKNGITLGIRLAEKLEEPAKVVIPQVIADFIEKRKGWDEDRQEYVEDDASDLLNAIDLNNASQHVDVVHYLLDNSETFAKAWIDGYEIEKYYMVHLHDGTTLVSDDDKGFNRANTYFMHEEDRGFLNRHFKFTEKQIKKIDKKLWPLAVEVQE